MKTYPVRRDAGSLAAFEISSAWVIFRPLYRILRSVRGVTDIKRNWFNDDRISFTFHGVPCVIHEPWGDSSRYWVGPSAPGTPLDMDSLHAAFKSYKRYDILGLTRP